MRADDSSNLATRDNTTARDVSDHRPVNMEDEPLREDETLLRAEPRGDNLAGQRSPTSDRHAGRDSDSGHDNNEPSTSVASSVGAATIKDNTESVSQVSGQIHRVRTLQTVIEIRVFHRYADVEVRPNDTRALYADCVVSVVEDGFKEAPQLKQD